MKNTNTIEASCSVRQGPSSIHCNFLNYTLSFFRWELSTFTEDLNDKRERKDPPHFEIPFLNPRSFWTWRALFSQALLFSLSSFSITCNLLEAHINFFKAHSHKASISIMRIS